MAASGGTARKGSGKRQRYGGKMGTRTKHGSKWVFSPRSHTHGGHSQARSGWTCGEAELDRNGRPLVPSNRTTSKHVPGRYRVSEPTKASHRHGIWRDAAGKVIR